MESNKRCNLHYQEKLNQIAQRHNATTQQIALSWLYHHGSNILLIPGTSKVDHVKENVKAVEIPLSEEEMASLGKA